MQETVLFARRQGRLKHVNPAEGRLKLGHFGHKTNDTMPLETFTKDMLKVADTCRRRVARKC